MTTNSIAFCCPGQGNLTADLALELSLGFRELELCEVASAIAGEDIIARVIKDGDEYAQRNEISAMITMLAAFFWADRLEKVDILPAAYAGFSVGQWSAMSLAGMITPEKALKIAWKRATFMNATEAVEGSMIAIMGLPFGKVEKACDEVADDEKLACVSNYNAIGQVTVSGHKAAVQEVAKKCAELGAFKVVDLPVSGAWHSPYLTSAKSLFREYLNSVEIKQPKMPVADNVTGGVLPTDDSSLRDTLALHLIKPVLWIQSIRNLRETGCHTFIEVGFGNTLTKFGPFIDRKSEFMRAIDFVSGR